MGNGAVPARQEQGSPHTGPSGAKGIPSCGTAPPRPTAPEPQSNPAPSELPAILHIALLDEDDSTGQLLRQMIKSHAPGWTLQTFHTTGAIPIAAWAKARAAAGRGSSWSTTVNGCPNVFVLDIVPNEGRSIEFIRKLSTLLPPAPTLVFTDRLEASSIVESLAAGASGYTPKHIPLAELVQVLRHLAAGQPALCPEAQKAVIACLRSGAEGKLALSRREREVISWAAQGLLQKEIAGAMGIADNTVHVHKVNIFRKLGAHSGHQAVANYLGIRVG